MVQTRSSKRGIGDVLFGDEDSSSSGRNKISRTDRSSYHEGSEAEDDGNQSELLNYFAAKSKRKGVPRAKRTSSASSSKKGKGKAVVRIPRSARLAFMMDLPTDIFYYVARDLSPLDLLHMARANRALRALLFSPSSQQLWRASRMGLPNPLPDGPDDLSEPLYASLVFEHGCFGCKATNARNIFFALRKCFCKSCTGKVLGPPNYSYSDIDDGLHQLVPHMSSDGSNPSYTHVQGPSGYVSSECVVVLSDLRAMIQQYYNMSQYSDEAAAHFLLDRKFKVKAIVDHSRLVDKWRAQDSYRKLVEKRTLIDQRYTEVVRRLSAKGYPNDLITQSVYDTDHSKRWNRLVRQPKVLTERVWNKIVPQLVEILEARRSFREARRVLDYDDYDDYGDPLYDVYGDSDDYGAYDYLDDYDLSGYFGHYEGVYDYFDGVDHDYDDDFGGHEDDDPQEYHNLVDEDEESSNDGFEAEDN